MDLTEENQILFTCLRGSQKPFCETVEGMELIDDLKKGTRRTNGMVTSNPDRILTMQVASDII